MESVRYLNKRFVFFIKVFFINNEIIIDRVVSFVEDFFVVDLCVNLYVVFV